VALAEITRTIKPDWILTLQRVHRATCRNAFSQKPRAGLTQLTNDSEAIIYVMAARKIVDDVHHITPKRGNGQLRREIWVDAQGKVTRFNLAYINYALHGGDNGRVVGYDNQHGCHHRHYFGVVAAVEFTSFDDIEDQFKADWAALRSKA
jgi:hypothetical protein